MKISTNCSSLVVLGDDFFFLSPPPFFPFFLSFFFSYTINEPHHPPLPHPTPPPIRSRGTWGTFFCSKQINNKHITYQRGVGLFSFPDSSFMYVTYFFFFCSFSGLVFSAYVLSRLCRWPPETPFQSVRRCGLSSSNLDRNPHCILMNGGGPHGSGP